MCLGIGFNLSRAEVYGVFTFYHDFRKQPAGRHVLKLCMAEACQSMGSDKLAIGLRKALGVSVGETSKDGSVTLEAVYCLGNCALAPAAMRTVNCDRNARALRLPASRLGRAGL